MKPWIGVDLDGTLAKYRGWTAPDNIGEPIPAMVERVKQMLVEGKDVRIFTARVGFIEGDPCASVEVIALVTAAIDKWCEKVFGRKLPITCIKDYGMVELYDDRCKQVIPNTGILLEDHYAKYFDAYWDLLNKVDPPIA